jgi:hypothetical protein
MAARNSRRDTQRLTPAEVAELFKVHPLTVTRWATQGRIGVPSEPEGVGGEGWSLGFAESFVAPQLRRASQARPAPDASSAPMRPT